MTIPDALRERGHRNYSLVLRSLAELSQKRVAEMLGLSENIVSAFKTDHLERACIIVAACGLRMVPVTEEVYEEAEISALKTLAALGIGRIRPRGERDE